MHFLAAFLLLNSLILCDPLEKGWKGIAPLSTDRAAVDKILGEPKIDEDDGYFSYSSDEIFIRVSYATDPCSEALYGRGDYNVPKDTVLYYIVRFRKLTELSEIQFERERYKRATGAHGPHLVSYYSSELGITIVTNIREGVEHVATIEYRPTSKDKEKYHCKK